MRRCPEEEVETEDGEEEIEEDEEFIRRAVSHMSVIRKIQEVKKISQQEWDAAVKVKKDGVSALVEANSGTFACIMDEHQYKALKKRGSRIKDLQPPSIGVKTIQCKLTPVGEFQTTIGNKHRTIEATFTVIKGKMDSPPLLSKEASIDLGFLKFYREGRLDPTVKKMQNILPEEEFKSVFEGIGEIRDTKNNESMEVHLEIDENAQPIAQKPRHVPYYLVDPLKEWLDTGVNEGIFKPVPEGEAITWCSPLVVQPKQKFVCQKTLKSDAQALTCVKSIKA